jgi:hypothetical protein
MTKSSNVTRIVYKDWEQGYNARVRTLGENTAAYTTMNMQVYDNGTLGVRPWCRIKAVTNLIADETLDNGASLQWHPAETNAKGDLYLNGLEGDVWAYDLSANTWAVGPSGVDTYTTRTDNRAAEWGKRNGWDNNGVRVGSAQHTVMPLGNYVYQAECIFDQNENVSAMTWPDPTIQLTGFALYRDRVFAWTWVNNSGSSNINRMYYTDAGDYSTSTTGNYFDIGADSYGYYILGVWALSDSLLMCMSDGGWWVLTGPPENGTLRFIGNFPIPSHGAAGTVLNNAVYFQAPYGRQVCVATPNGVDSSTLSHVRPWNSDGDWSIFHDYRGLSSHQEQSIFLPSLRNSDDQWFDALEMVNGSWNYSAFGRTEMGSSTGNIGILRDTALIGNNKAYAFVMEDPDEPNSVETQLYTRDIVLNRPSRSDDYWSDIKEVAAGATSTVVSKGAVKLASFSPEGQEVRVRQVMVDFHYWSDGETYYKNPEMKCLLMDGANTTRESIDTFVYSAMPAGGDVLLGKPWRHIFRFPIDDNAFEITQQILIEEIMSIAIDRIVVDYEVRPDGHFAGQMAGT